MPNFIQHTPKSAVELMEPDGTPAVQPKKKRGKHKRKSERRKQISKLPPRYQDLADGRLNVEDLDFEELTRGQLRGEDGKFRGPAPHVIPRAFHQAMQREINKRMQDMFNGKLQLSFDVLVEIAKSGPARERLTAAQYLMERAIGPITQQSVVKSEVTIFEDKISSGGFLVDLGEVEEG